MLKNWIFGADQRDTHACRKLLKERREALARPAAAIKEAKLPIIVLVEGWGAAGKGSVIHSLIRELDPRFFKVRSVGMPTEEERRWPFLKRHFETIPEEGKILFLDSGWMDETVRERMRRDLSDQEYARRLESIRVFERQLAAGGYLLVKLFLHISEDTQSRRLEKLMEDKDTAWRVGENDRKQNKNYDAALEAFDEYLTATDFPFAPWKVIGTAPTLSIPAGRSGLALRPDHRRHQEPSPGGAAAPSLASGAHSPPQRGKAGQNHGRGGLPQGPQALPQEAGGPPQRALPQAGAGGHRLRGLGCRRKGGTSSAWPPLLTLGAVRYCPSPVPLPMSSIASTSGGSGPVCPKPATSPSLTAVGTAG